MATFGSRLKHAWNAFVNLDFTSQQRYDGASSFGSGRPDRRRFATISNERSIISAILTRIAIDVSSVEIRHVRLDDNNRYKEDIDSPLNSCLTLEANIDQAAQAFRRDIAMTLFDRGVAAIVPVDTSVSPNESGSFDILTMRVGEVVEWKPRHVRVSLYNEAKGYREEITLEKKFVAIVENPLYTVMNEPNSTLQRLIRKLGMLDAIDEQVSSGKLDLIIQLPYTIKSEAKRAQAEKRRTEIEMQLRGSQYGIAYTDGTEKVIQLNRPVENTMMKQIEFLVDMLYGQLGLTAEILNGTADEKAMLNYNTRTIEPIMDAIVEAMRRSFLTKTARTQKQTIMYFRNPFRLIPIEKIAEIADVFCRNEIASSNEIRGIVGWKPDRTDPKSDQLINSNMPQPGSNANTPMHVALPPASADTEVMAQSFDEIDSAIDDAFKGLG